MLPCTCRSSRASGASFWLGSVAIISRKRDRPAKPLANISEKLASFRMGLTKVPMYKEKVSKSTRSIWLRIIKKPPKAITATWRMHRKNSMVELNRAMALWNWRLEVLYFPLARLNRSFSQHSLAKALAVRMPEREDSISVLMWPTFCLTSLETAAIRLRWVVTTRAKMGIKTATTRASLH